MRPSNLPVSLSTGSAHTKSQNNPDLGISLTRSIFSISAIYFTTYVRCRYLRKCHRGCREICCWWWLLKVDYQRGPWPDRISTGHTWPNLHNNRSTLWSEVEERGQLPAFVVASQHKYCLSKLYLDGQNEAQNFDWEATSVDIISQENVFSCFERSSCIVVNDLDEVIELSVNVSDNGDGIHNFDDVGFLSWVREALLKTCLAFLRSYEYSFLDNFPSRL